jgi:hypothetical protein
MTCLASFPGAAITYRGSRPCGAEVELHLVIDPNFATVARAWAALSAIHPDIDPRSIEIEIRACSGAMVYAA